MNVLSLAAYRLMRLGEQDDRLASAVAPFLAPGNTPLSSLERLLRLAISARVKDARSIRQRGQRFDAEINPASCPVGAKGRIGASAQETQTYRPSASPDTVTVFGVPSNERDQRTAIRPIFDGTR
jgi:hypothetical protein